ncbi:MAG: PaREP1 family protein [Pyrobaculum sp.]
MEIPIALLKEAERRGVDLVDLLSRSLGLDPPRRASAHLELSVKYLEEGRELVDKDPVQASEKLYKAAEEAVKALAVALGLDEAEKAGEMGRWTATLLFSAVDKIAEKRGREFKLWWKSAWFLHVEGFHEARLTAAQVRDEVDYVERIVEAAAEAVEGKPPRGRGA